MKMSTRFLSLKICVLTFLLSLGLSSNAQNLTSFNNDWLFTLSDSPDYSLTTYKPSGWTKLDLPHDWSIEHDFSEDLEGCTAFLPGGIGWY
ncbi:MAG: hypothetical protein ACR2MV_14065, partial [Lutimonas sp.]